MLNSLFAQIAKSNHGQISVEKLRSNRHCSKMKCPTVTLWKSFCQFSCYQTIIINKYDTAPAIQECGESGVRRMTFLIGLASNL